MHTVTKTDKKTNKIIKIKKTFFAVIKYKTAKLGFNDPGYNKLTVIKH